MSLEEKAKTRNWIYHDVKNIPSDKRATDEIQAYLLEKLVQFESADKVIRKVIKEKKQEIKKLQKERDIWRRETRYRVDDIKRLEGQFAEVRKLAKIIPVFSIPFLNGKISAIVQYVSEMEIWEEELIGVLGSEEKKPIIHWLVDGHYLCNRDCEITKEKTEGGITCKNCLRIIKKISREGGTIANYVRGIRGG